MSKPSEVNGLVAVFRAWYHWAGDLMSRWQAIEERDRVHLITLRVPGPLMVRMEQVAAAVGERGPAQLVARSLAVFEHLLLLSEMGEDVTPDLHEQYVRKGPACPLDRPHPKEQDK